MQRNRLVGEIDGIAHGPHIIRSDDSNTIQSIEVIRHNVRDGYSLPRETVPVQGQVMPGIVVIKPANRPDIVVAAACDREQTGAVPRHAWRRDHGPAYWAGGSWGSRGTTGLYGLHLCNCQHTDERAIEKQHAKQDWQSLRILSNSVHSS